ncbi:hypothetical protein B0H16DRAFT_1506386 [Mycena metata]|uniref:Uncharacterized protein n=1 Tax=Mycena metata TaxID=1033252 RepID=A0AAD7K1F4_9AGAR|nr:hypothetical protein B0H16DRAFT_1506386 [Mycena metata]
MWPYFSSAVYAMTVSAASNVSALWWCNSSPSIHPRRIFDVRYFIRVTGEWTIKPSWKLFVPYKQRRRRPNGPIGITP